MAISVFLLQNTVPTYAQDLLYVIIFMKTFFKREDKNAIQKSNIMKTEAAISFRHSFALICWKMGHDIRTVSGIVRPQGCQNYDWYTLMFWNKKRPHRPEPAGYVNCFLCPKSILIFIGMVISFTFSTFLRCFDSSTSSLQAGSAQLRFALRKHIIRLVECFHNVKHIETNTF